MFLHVSWLPHDKDVSISYLLIATVPFEEIKFLLPNTCRSQQEKKREVVQRRRCQDFIESGAGNSTGILDRRGWKQEGRKQ